MPDNGISNEIIKTNDDNELIKDINVNINITKKPKIFTHKRK